MSFQPENVHLNLSAINENRPSPPRNIIVTFLNTEDTELAVLGKSKRDQSPAKDWESEGLTSHHQHWKPEGNEQILR